MTDIMPGEVRRDVGFHTSEDARKRTARRYAAERRFRLVGLGAVLLAALFLLILMWTIVGQGLPAFTYNYAALELQLDGENINQEQPTRSNFDGIINQAIYKALPFAKGRTDRRTARGLISSGAPILLGKEVGRDPGLIGGPRDIALPVSDTVDLYLKGIGINKEQFQTLGEASPTGTTGDIEILTTSNGFSEILREAKDDLARQADQLAISALNADRILRRSEESLAALEEDLPQTNDADERAVIESRVAELRSTIAASQARAERDSAQANALAAQAEATSERETIGSNLPSYLIYLNGGVVRVTSVEARQASGTVLVPLESDAPTPSGDWSMARIAEPESERKISDLEIAYTDELVEQGLLERKINWVFFTRGASREPEMAGIWGAVVGSFFTMVVTLFLSFPLGVAAAIYLEEFAPKNRLTDIIEVNINNLAAVPSIVFGLLGLAVFLNFFGMPRSAPLVGGMVLALMTLPTIIIASRAALKAVPPSIREAALGVGASPIQTVFHHVLPLAMPGILTGTIIGMAQALGETAPLLMIGMVAFIVDIPGGFTDPATVMPVQIFMWADFPEPAFQQKTSAAIMVLLAFLVIMNALAVLLRKRFERRW